MQFYRFSININELSDAIPHPHSVRPPQGPGVVLAEGRPPEDAPQHPSRLPEDEEGADPAKPEEEHQRQGLPAPPEKLRLP